ncbi:hypothetical protein JAAARDRAFT_197587, partial [Jaapia argillacea MUCL 33604]
MSDPTFQQLAQEQMESDPPTTATGMLQKYTNHGDLESSASQEGMEVDWEPLAPGAPVRLYGQEARYRMDGPDYQEEQEGNRCVFTQEIFGASADQGAGFVDEDERMSPPPSPSHHREAPPTSHQSSRRLPSHPGSLTIPSPTIASFEDAPDYDVGPPSSSQELHVAPRAISSFDDVEDPDITPTGSQEMAEYIPSSQDLPAPSSTMYVDNGDDIAPPSDDRLAFIVDDDDIPLPALEVLSPSPPTYVNNDGDIPAPAPSQGALAISPPTYIDDDEDIPAPGQGTLIASSPINTSDDGDIPPLSQEGSIPSPPTYINDDDDIPPPSQGPFTPSPPTYISDGDDVALPTPSFLAPSSPTFIPDDDD